MKYKLIVCDYDDTLTKNDKTVSDETVKTIAEFRANGGLFVFSTGRTHKNVTELCNPQIGCTDNVPAITCQGAIIRETVSGKVISYIPLENDTAFAMLRMLEADNYIFACFGIEDEIVANYTGDARIGNARRTGVLVSDMLKRDGEICTRIVVVGKAGKIAALQSKLLSEYGNEIEAETTWPDFLEIYSRRAGKGNAVKFLAEYLNIPQDQIAAFGDSNNDAGMIKYAGLGVAVANAGEKALAAADYISLSNDEDGVAYAIRKLILS